MDQINSDVYLSVSDCPHLFSAIKLKYVFFVGRDSAFSMTNSADDKPLSFLFAFNKVPTSFPEKFLLPACAKMFPALAGQTLNIPLSFQCSPSCITAIIMATAEVRPALGLLSRTLLKL